MDVATDFRLEVLVPPAGPVNLVPNPSGVGGSWGWNVAGTTGSLTSGTWAGQPRLIGRDGAIYQTVMLPVKAGDLFRVSWIFDATTGVGKTGDETMAAVIQYRDIDDVLISQVTTSRFAPSSTIRTSGNLTVPATATEVRVYLLPYKDAAGAPALSTVSYYWGKVTVTTGATTADIANTVAASTWQEISTFQSVKISREVLNVGMLTGTLLDNALGPATSTLLRPGVGIRASGKTNVGTWLPLFTGTIREIDTEPDPRAERLAITISATDANTDLAGASTKTPVRTLEQAYYLLRDLPVAWNINGVTGWLPYPLEPLPSVDGTVLDHLQLLRFMTLCRLWVDAENVLRGHPYNAANVNESIYDPSEPSLLDSSRVTGTEYGMVYSDSPNTVTLTHHHRNTTTGTDTSITRGPFRDLVSVRRWGPRPASAGVVTYSTAGPTAIGDSVLYRFGLTPPIAPRPYRVRFNVTNPADQTEAYAMADLYRRVRVQLPDQDIDWTGRIVAISHTITGGKDPRWRIEWDLDPQAAVVQYPNQRA